MIDPHNSPGLEPLEPKFVRIDDQRLDWRGYTPKTLAQARDNNSVESYYEIMLVDARSDPNEWDDKDFERRLKSYYAETAGRANFVK